MTNQRCIVLLGPTAVGKSSLVYENLSPDRYFVISADSMQIYRGFNVATATPDSSERRRFTHAGINEKSPSDEYNVNEFLERADNAIERARGADMVPLIVGGTGLYLKTFLYGLDDMPPPNEEFRKTLRGEAEETSREAIHDRLKEVDPESARQIHPNDLKRTIRALEIYHETGETKSDLINRQERQRSIRSSIDPTVIGLKRSLESLKRRIRARVESMLDAGMVEEINHLREEWEISQTIEQAIGFEEVSRYLDGAIDRDGLLDEIASNTYEFARKQMTWFRQLPVESWYHPERDREELIDHIGSVTERAN